MPIYSYSCPKCGKKYEVLQPMSARHAYKCEACGAKAERVFDPPGTFIIDFKPGWDMGLGEYVNTKRERENIIAERGLERIKS